MNLLRQGKDNIKNTIPLVFAVVLGLLAVFAVSKAVRSGTAEARSSETEVASLENDIAKIKEGSKKRADVERIAEEARERYDLGDLLGALEKFHDAAGRGYRLNDEDWQKVENAKETALRHVDERIQLYEKWLKKPHPRPPPPNVDYDTAKKDRDTIITWYLGCKRAMRPK